MTQLSWQQAGSAVSALSSAKDATQVGLDKESVLGMIYEHRPFKLANSQPITGEFAYDLATATGTTPLPVIELAIENGNSCTRAMALHSLTGFYDGHDVTVRRVGKQVRVSGVKVTDGIARIVRDMGAYLRQPGNFPMMDPPSYAQALDMMRTGEIKIGGMPLDNQPEIERGRRLIKDYKNKEAGQLVRTMMANHPNLDSVFAFTGGGAIDLAEQIKEQTRHRPKNLTRILAPEVARIANVAGIYWLLNLSKRRRSILRSS